MLRSSSYRDLKVVDIAREAGTSPATFYQYFPDVESAILVLADDMVDAGVERFAAVMSDNSWKGRVGYEAAEALADAVLTFWDENQPVLRVVNLATDEGDKRFATVRTRLLRDLNNALSAAAKDHQANGKGQPDVAPDAIAGVLVAMLVHVAAYRVGFELGGAGPRPAHGHGPHRLLVDHRSETSGLIGPPKGGAFRRRCFEPVVGTSSRHGGVPQSAGVSVGGIGILD